MQEMLWMSFRSKIRLLVLPGGGRLWIATHTLLVNSRMVAYYLDKKTDKLIALSDYKIPQKVQGVTFDDSGNVVY